MESASMFRNLLLLLCFLLAPGAHAAGTDAASAYDAAVKNAEARYGEDRKLCADEATSARRMQCLRDAKEEYNRALESADGKRAVIVRSAPPAATCADCGKVIAVAISERDGDPGAVGMIAGGVAGALLGRQIGKGSGKDLATIAGAAGGAYAGRQIEGKMNKVRSWSVSVHFDSGEERSFSFDHDPGLAVGDQVRAAGGSVARR